MGRKVQDGGGGTHKKETQWDPSTDNLNYQ